MRANNDNWVEALASRCLREIGDENGVIAPGKAASWFHVNVKDPMTAGEWMSLLCDFVTKLLAGGHIKGH